MMKIKRILPVLIMAYIVLCAFSSCRGKAESIEPAEPGTGAIVNDDNVKTTESGGKDNSEKYSGDNVSRKSEVAVKNISWEEDIDSLASQLDSYIKKFYDIENSDKDAKLDKTVREELEKLRDNISQLDDFAIESRIQEITALFNDGHMITDLMYSDYHQNVLPVYFDTFEDNVYCTTVYHKTYENILNCRLDAINGISTEEVFERFIKLFSGDNIYCSKHWFGRRLNCPAILKALGLIDDFEASPAYTFTDLNGNTFDVTIDKRIAHDSLPEAITKRAASADAYFESKDESVWVDYIKDSGALYVRMYMVAAGGELKGIEAEVKESIELQDIQKIIIDLRGCEGGPITSLQHSLFSETLKSFGLGSGELYVITNYSTFSMGATIAMYLKDEAGAVVTGLPPGGGKPYVGKPREVKLKTTGFSINIPTINNYTNGAIDYRPTAENYILEPDIKIGMSIEDYINRRDPVLELILSM